MTFSFSPFTSPLLKSFPEARVGLQSLRSASPSLPPKSAPRNPAQCLRPEAWWDHTRCVQSTFLGSQAGAHLWTWTLGKGIVAERAVRACWSDSPWRLLCHLHLPISGWNPMAGSLDLFLCLSLSLPTMQQRESNLPCSLIFPHWPTPGIQGRRQKQWPPGLLLDFRAFAFPHVSRSAGTRERRGQRMQAWVPAKPSADQQLKECPQTPGGWGKGRGQAGSQEERVAESS